jgi:hypothetical protein
MKIKFVVRNDTNTIVRIHGSLRAAFDEARGYLKEVYTPQLRKMGQLLERETFEPGEAWLFYNNEISKDVFESAKIMSVSVTVCEDVS